jgi:predicted nuclease of predicted toxin-antitoxin system
MRPAFVVDESTGQAVVDALRRAGYDVVGVAEIMPQADDASIMAFAAESDRILITNDKDFGEHAFRHEETHAGVLLLRLDDDRAAAKARVTLAVVTQFEAQLRNNFTVATQERVRIRRRVE